MRILRAAVPLLSLAVVAAACSSGAAAGGNSTPTAAPPSAAPSAAAGSVSVDLASSSLGNILVDGTGHTLYVFTADKNGTSACTGGCVDNWPPLVSSTTPTLGTGLDAEDFASITRDDGTKQVTFYGQPVYSFAGDKAAGDTNGQGLNGKWFVVGADGKPIGVAASAPSAAPSAATGSVTVDLASSSLGNILVDGTGRTLYVFTADSNGTSACTGSCAASWPPLTSDAVPMLGTGLDATAFATITRDDGTKQVTFHGMPLYYFAGDKAAGDTNGQGLNGKWYVVGADGGMIGAAAAPAPSSSSNGYSY